MSFVGVSETQFDLKIPVLHFEVNLADTKYFCVPESFRFLQIIVHIFVYITYHVL